ncbi:hypothetical protein F5Y07DRAFT_179710 [Xylaria sp. FL0933]|nr:hypothetical protein F5Y07DRAFT_179710 [Xylaria sp. FL0933]
MATADTVNLGPPHAPKEESIKAFTEIEAELKKELLHLRHTYQKHEPEYFAAASHLSDHALTSFTASTDLESVRVAPSAYGIHLLGKLRIPALLATKDEEQGEQDGSKPGYLHVRVFTSGPENPAKLHCIHTEEREEEGGGKRFRAIFTKDDPLEWFDT